MKFDKIIKNIISEEKIKGGLASKMTPEDIAKKHDVPLEDILQQIKKGIKVEFEHTPVEAIAKEIAMDHLEEIPYYYDYLADMEDMAKKEMEQQKPKEEMVSSDVVGSSDFGKRGVAPQDDVEYAKGDSRIAKPLFTKNKKRKRLQIQRRPKTGM